MQQCLQVVVVDAVKDKIRKKMQAQIRKQCKYGHRNRNVIKLFVVLKNYRLDGYGNLSSASNQINKNVL